MKKTILMVFVLLIAFVTATEAQKPFKKGMAVYVNSISNPDKTIDFIVGVYPETYDYNSDSEYSTLLMRVLNNSKNRLEWEDYKIYILLKDGSLFYNYKTKAETGQYACIYRIKANGGFNDQQVCFSKKFDPEDIDKIWLSFNDHKFFVLSYVKGTKKSDDIND